MLRPRLALLRRASTTRSFSSTACIAYTPRRASLGTAKNAVEPRATVVLGADGRERRPLPPLGLDGKPVQQPKPVELDEAGAQPLVKEVKTLDNPAALAAKKEVKPRRTRAKKADKGKAKTADEEPDGLDWSQLTPLERTIRQFVQDHPGYTLLTQVGSFFESYFEQAPPVAKILGIKLTSKKFGRGGADKKQHAFAGFPLSHLSKHVSVLIEAGHKVVIVEEFKEHGSEEITRKVTRKVTSGTGVDEAFVSLEKANYVLALGVVDGGSVKEEIGMAYRDVSTGASFTRTTKLKSLRDDIQLVQPKEVVVDERIRGTPLGQRILELLEGEQRREGLVISDTSTEAVPSTSSAVRSSTSAAEDVLLAYLATTLVTTPPPRLSSTYIDPASVMKMDAVTLQSLEIRESLRGGVKGSLMSAVRRTVTPGGQRLLAERLCNPSTELSTINDRLSLVSAFLESIPQTRAYLSGLLRSLDDTPRLLQRLAFRRPNAANDLLGLKRTMRALDDIRATINECVPANPAEAEELGLSPEEHRVLSALLERMGEYRSLADSIEAAVDEEALRERETLEERKAQVMEELGQAGWEKEREKAATEDKEDGLWGDRQPWVIRSDFSSSLVKKHETLASLRQRAAELEQRLRERYKSPNLTLRLVQRIGPGVHVLTRDGCSRIEADPAAMQSQKSGSTRVYVVQEWVNLHREIVQAQDKILGLEKDAMQVLIARTLERYTDLLQTADALAELDVSLGFAELAQERVWCRPEVDESKSLDIVDGRHPTVENALMAQNRAFDPNSVAFAHPDDSPEKPSLVHVLTGPNMAGKSTYLRQTALIVVLAQAGSYVPASSARIGIFDRVFSRVGARDELDRDRSTFMIECDEATSILENATSRSLVLLDELGRGTSPLDGVAIAYGALEHLTHVNRCRTLFATHFHALGSFLGFDPDDPEARGDWEGVEFWCTEAEESEDTVRFPHSIRRGLNDDSGGLTIARLAGMPVRAVLKAQEVRERLRSGEVALHV
ncbi:hypothetical protein JCM10207_006504 [Rhodosporidiobolus poonsookiae]